MADAVTSRTLFNGRRRLIMQFTNVSDGTGESAVVKVDKSTLTGLNGLEPGRLVIERVQGTCDGMVVKILYDHTTDDLALTCAGSYFDQEEGVPGTGLIDPASSGGTGDILFTTVGHSSGDSYSITLWMRKKD